MFGSLLAKAAGRAVIAAVGLSVGLSNPVSVSQAQVACPPRLAARYPTRCSFMGRAPTPGATSAGYPLPTRSLDASYRFPPRQYLEVKDSRTPLFPDSGAARRRSNASRRVGQGFVYLATSSGEYGGSDSILPTRGGFVREEHVRAVRTSQLQGLAFYRTPRRQFGWINAGGVCPRRAPSAQAEIAERCFARYHVVEILGEQREGSRRWLQIGPEMWIVDELVAVVRPDASRPEGVEGDRWIRVNLDEQVVTVYESGQLIYATVASTGREGFWTQPGTFQVWAKLELDNMTGGEPGTESYYYLEDVPWVLYFDEARALHGTYWHDKFGTPTSRGCVNLSPADARWMYEFAREGAWVHVWDPSGETPMDPALYGPGGA